MSDNGTARRGPTLEMLATKIAALEAESTAQKAEIAQLKGHSTVEGTPGFWSPTSPGPGSDVAADSADNAGPLGEQSVSRRGALRALGGVAAGGVGLAIGSAFLGAEPAGALNPSLLLDQSNTGTASTVLKGDFQNTSLFAVSNQETTNPGSAIYAKNVPSGISQNGTIVGDTTGAPGPAVVGTNSNGTAIYGVSVGKSGVFTQLKEFGIGVFGDTNGTAGYGVLGTSSDSAGVGVHGEMLSGGIGVSGDASDGTGVQGTGFVGVRGVGNGHKADIGNSHGAGVVASNVGGPSLALDPFGSTTLPTSSEAGEFIVLSNGSLWYCYATDTWVQLNKGFTNLLPTPIRVFDSRTSGAANVADPTRAAGPFAASSIVTLQITGATVGGHSVPAGASAVIGNVTAISPSAAGWLTLFPHGEPTPLVANLNFQVGDQARGNFCVVGLDATGKMDVFAQSATGVVFDVTGFVF